MSTLLLSILDSANLLSILDSTQRVSGFQYQLNGTVQRWSCCLERRISNEVRAAVTAGT